MKFKILDKGLAGLVISGASLLAGGCDEVQRALPYATVKILDNGCLRTETFNDMNRDGKADILYTTEMCDGQVIYTDVVSNLDLKRRG